MAVNLCKNIFFLFTIIAAIIFSVCPSFTAQTAPNQVTPSPVIDPAEAERIRKQKEEEQLRNELKQSLTAAKDFVKKNQILLALPHYEKIIYNSRNLERDFPEVTEIFKPNSNQSLIPHLLKLADNYYDKQQFKNALYLYKYLVQYNANNSDIVKKYNIIYRRYRSILDQIKKAIDLERDDRIDARDAFRKVLELLNEGDRGELYNAIFKRVTLIQNELENNVLPKTLKEAQENFRDKKYDKAEKAVLFAIRIKSTPDLTAFLERIRLTRTNEAVARLFEKAEKEYQDKKFDTAIQTVNLIVKEFRDSETIIDQANKTIERYEKGKRAHAFRTAGLKYFEQEIWTQALTNFLDYKRFTDKQDTEIEEKIKICNEKIRGIANLEEFNRLFAQAVNHYNGKKYLDAREVFYRLRDNFPFKRDEVLKYIEKIDEIVEKQNKTSQILANADRLFRIGETRYKNAGAAGTQSIAERIELLNSAKLNFHSARHLYEQIQRTQKVNECNEMLENIDKRIKSIKAQENDRLRELVKELLNRGKTLFDQQNFQRAIETFNKILEQIPDHPEAQNYLKAAREAILVKEETQLTPQHRHYLYYITFKKRGEEFFNRAEELSRNGKNITTEAKNQYNKSLEQWRTILLWFPNNEEAHEYIRKIYRRVDPPAYRGFLQKYVDLIRLYLRPPNPQLERAYHLLLIIQKEDKNFFDSTGLAALLEQAKPQRLQTALSEPQKNQIRGILQEANIAFASKNDDRTIALTGQAININPFSNDPLMNSVKLLLTQAINRKKFGAGGEAPAAGPAPENFRQATRYYYQAMAAYQQKNYARTIQLCKQALKYLPGHTQAQQLLRIAEQRL